MQHSENAQYAPSPAFLDAISGLSDSADRTSTTLYENEIPANIEIEIERLYGNLFSSFVRFKAYGNKSDISVFVIRKNETPISIVAFRRDSKRITVLNEQIELHEWAINRFSSYIFSHFESVNIISFKAIKTNISRMKYANHALHFTNDVVISCPASEQEYLANLGKSTRRNMMRYLKYFQRDFPSFSCAVHEREECSHELFQQIVHFSRSRMASKNRISGIDRVEAERLWEMVKTHGFIVALVIDGRVCAGMIGYRVGSNIFARVNAHDSNYNEYGLGILACYLAICECIKRGSKEIHLLWGQEEYKFRLLGKDRNFDSITIYRSKSILLMNSVSILKDISTNAARAAKIWALNPANQNKIIPKCAIMARDFLRAARSWRRQSVK